MKVTLEKKSVHCYFFFDEIQNVPNWERFVRRLIDTEDVSVTVTGSSAKLLSAELATGLRGRSLDLEVFPFSFKEYLQHHAIQLPHKQPIGAKTRLALNHHAELYCRKGGLPELQKLLPVCAREVAQSYVDAVVLRDVIERHGVSNVEALRSLLDKVLREPATKLSIHKVYQDFKSRGLRVSKDDLYVFRATWRTLIYSSSYPAGPAQRKSVKSIRRRSMSSTTAYSMPTPHK